MSKSDFSGADWPDRAPRWGLYLAVLLLHVLVLAGLNAVLTLNRLVAQGEPSLEVAILPQEEAAQEEAAKKPSPKPAESAESAEAKPADQPVKAKPPPAEPVAPTPVALPPQEGLTPTPSAQTIAAPVAASLPASHDLPALRVRMPEPVQLRYSVTKDGDSARRASLTWQLAKEGGASQATHYELDYELHSEAISFGISSIKQTSRGRLAVAGLMPTRFGEKRRGKSEQATHFDHAKNTVTFSNNRPEARLAMGAQDKASVLIQLASLLAGQPERFQAGQVIELPVATVDELDIWAFEVQASESLALPIGQTQAIKLLRRPRRAFDQTVELWLAPALAYLPVRIRWTDSSGVTDAQLSSKD